MVALTGIEGANSKFSSVQLSSTDSSCVQLVWRAPRKARHRSPTLSLGCHSASGDSTEDSPFRLPLRSGISQESDGSRVARTVSGGQQLPEIMVESRSEQQPPLRPKQISDFVQKRLVSTTSFQCLTRVVLNSLDSAGIRGLRHPQFHIYIRWRCRQGLCGNI
jgi:hypothetical protein